MTPAEAIALLEARMNARVIGQEHLSKRLILGLLAGGHMLIEGLPGLAKTRMVKTLAELIEARFTRIQFTPDLRTRDVIGEERAYEEDGKTVHRFVRGPIFGNIVLADEINRAPAKVQAALLEAMEERQVSIAGKRFALPELFMVLATQNPIEQEGTYPLSEAQKDRFLMHVHVDYVDRDAELKMLRMIHDEHTRGPVPAEKIAQEILFAARREVADVQMDEAVGRYLVELVFATRHPLQYSRQLDVMIDVGVSPRGTLALGECARAYAWTQGRKNVTPDDIAAVIHDVFRHRLIASEHTRRNEISNDDIVDILLKQVPKPA